MIRELNKNFLTEQMKNGTFFLNNLKFKNINIYSATDWKGHPKESWLLQCLMIKNY